MTRCASCTRPGRQLTRGLCKTCYMRHWRRGTIEQFPRVVYATACTSDGCGRGVHARGLCKHHYVVEHERQVREHGWYRGIEVGA